MYMGYNPRRLSCQMGAEGGQQAAAALRRLSWQMGAEGGAAPGTAWAPRRGSWSVGHVAPDDAGYSGNYGPGQFVGLLEAPGFPRDRFDSCHVRLQDEAMALFDNIGKDAGGAVSADEWQAGFDAIGRSNANAVSRKEWCLKYGTTEMFDRMPKNASGVLTRNEWQSAFQNFDRDRNGMISVPEWLSGLGMANRLQPCHTSRSMCLAPSVGCRQVVFGQSLPVPVSAPMVRVVPVATIMVQVPVVPIATAAVSMAPVMAPRPMLQSSWYACT